MDYPEEAAKKAIAWLQTDEGQKQISEAMKPVRANAWKWWRSSNHCKCAVCYRRQEEMHGEEPENGI